MTAPTISATCAVMLMAVLALPASGQSPVPTATPSDATPLHMNDARFAFTATGLSDGTVLVAGGTDAWSTLASAEVYDPTTRQFRAVGSLGTARYGHRATALPDGRVLITGGAPSGTPRGMSSVEIYDPATETFSPSGRLKERRVYHAAALLDDGRVLISGGVGKGSAGPKSSAELYDPATGMTTSVGKMHKTRMVHAATRLEDGRIAIIGGVSGGRPNKPTLEVYDPRRERFQRPLGLPESASFGRHDVPRLADGRLFHAAAGGAAILIAPDAQSSERVDGPPCNGGQATATLLDDGRVVLIGSCGEGPASVRLFDPTTDVLQSADPMRQTRQDHAAVRLPDGTVLVVGGIRTAPDCYQALDTAEIWDPIEMASIAGDSDTECVPWEEPPLPPLGAEISGGRIEMPGSGFAITVPDDWSVELAHPDHDVFSAEPGTAWEALRAMDPQDTNACSVAVGVAAVSLRKQNGTAAGGSLPPAWHPRKPGILTVPDPQVTQGNTGSSFSAPRERLHRDHPGLEHDALYSLHCVGGSERRFEAIADSFEFLPRGE